MINEILTQLKTLETRLVELMSQDMPDYLKEEELNNINEKLDELSSRVDNLR